MKHLKTFEKYIESEEIEEIEDIDENDFEKLSPKMIEIMRYKYPEKYAKYIENKYNKKFNL